MSKQAQRLKKYFKKWLPKLGLQNWDITMELVPDQIDPGDKQGINFAAECFPHYEYEAATIRFAEPLVASLNEFGVEELVVHELQHCLLHEAKIVNPDSEEHVATLLTRAFLKLGA